MHPRLLWAGVAIATLTGCPTQPPPSVTASPSVSPGPAASASPMPSPAAEHNSNVSEQEGCKYLQQGPAVALTAGASAASAPAIRSDDRRYDITLRPTETGYVKFTAPSTAEWSIYADREVAFVLRDAGDAIKAGARIAGSAFCSEIFTHRVFELVAGDYTIELYSEQATQVKLVVEETHPGGAGAAPH